MPNPFAVYFCGKYISLNQMCQHVFAFQKYIPNVRKEIGASSLPNGIAYYAACLKWHLSVVMTPDAIHQLGLEEVDRISNNMKKVCAN